MEFEFADSSGVPDDFDLSKSTPLGLSPVDNSPVHDIGTAYASESSMEGDKKGLRINKIILNQHISPENIKAMLNGESTELLKDFVTSKTRRKFEARLKLSKTGKISFEFPPRVAKRRFKAKTKKK